MDSGNVSIESPFYWQHYHGLCFPGMEFYRPRGNTERASQTRRLLPKYGFYLPRNGEYLLGFPLYKKVRIAADIVEPEKLWWAMGYNSLHSLRFYFFCPASPESDNSLPPRVRNRMRGYATDVAVMPLNKERPDGGAREGYLYRMRDLYIYPRLCRTTRRKQGGSIRHYIEIPDVFRNTEWAGAHYDVPDSRLSVGHSTIYDTPLTLLYDTNANLIFFRHHDYDREILYKNFPDPKCPIREIDGCHWELID